MLLLDFFNIISVLANYLLVLILILVFIYALIFLFKKVFHKRNYDELLFEIRVLQKENIQLKKQIYEMEERLAIRNSLLNSNSQQTNSFVNIGTLKVKNENILYIASQSSELLSGGNSRIKIIHYNNTEKTDSVYGSFDAILEQLSGDFMLINKNQMINLREIHKIQGSDLYLKNIKTPFIVSDTKNEELEIRISKL